MIRPGFVGFVALIVVVTVAGVGGPMAIAGATTAPQDDPNSISSSAAVESAAYTLADSQSQEFDETKFEITVYENGTATWTFRYEKELNGSDEEDAFETFAERFENEETPLYDTFTSMADNLTKAGVAETDREMEASDFNRSAGVEEQFPGGNQIGVVEMSFTWDGFAAVEDGSVVVGDVFRNINLGPDQQIVVRAGGNLVFEYVAPDDARYATTDLEDANEVVWLGEQEFLNGHPRVVFDDPAVDSGHNADGPLSTLTDGENSLPWPLLLLVVFFGLVGAVVWYRWTDRDRSAGDDAAAPSSGPPAAPDETASAGDEPGTSADASTDDVLPDEELLTDEDRVVKLIRENGGRMKQVNIVEETGWSKSKVSMLLSDMEDEGTISKLRVGRENIISLEGFEPEATKSPFEE
ncbi:helix-turn-helix transcriptional regulator [Halosolutus gelatinilyticus]|uniref:helix-turn-helix transcriptional regulator n=1 Tax=Halosolutus gelatinilyticus TaxID=2931975 RepID=UPI001FF6B852|nr:hypothetical protein [Halosolutus gelatinilyticus]